MRANKNFQVGVIFFLAMFGFLLPARAQHFLGEASRSPTNLTTLLQSAKPKVQTYTGSFVVNTDSREEVRDFYNAIFPASENVPINSTADVANCFPGTNSPLFVQSVLRRINWFRAMAGVPANVIFSSIYNSNAQAVAVMISSSGQLNHNPPPDWPCYSEAGGAAAGGNQAGGWDGADAITGYIWDFGNGNSEVGHRRWILFPSEQIMGTGDVQGTNSYISGNCTYVFDSSINDPRPATRQPYVAWPPEGFVPYQIVYPYWSFALSNADLSAATVSMLSNGVPVSLAIQTYQTGYGENTIVWVPMGLDANCECTTFPFSGADTVYSISVSNIVVGSSNVNFSYQVTVFDPAIPGADFVPTIVNGPTQTFANVANNFSCTPLANTNTTGYQWRTGQLISGNVSENADYDLTNGLVNFSISPSPNYPIVTDAPDGSGSNCFHLCHAGTNSSPQIFQLNELLFPATNTILNFDGVLGVATTDEIARVQVSTDGGGTWHDIYTQPGGNASSTFTAFSLSLSNYAGLPALLRFNYDFEGGSYYADGFNWEGWCLENIVVTNTQQLANIATNFTASTNLNFATAQTGNFVLQAAPIIFSQFPLDFGPTKIVCAIVNNNPLIVMNQPLLTNKNVLLNFSVSNLTNATFHLLLATQLDNLFWTTDTSAIFATNILNNSYRFTATNDSSEKFYRVQTP